jgi:cystathionine beta-lyase/cystathionine gamma-synthase
MQKRIDDVCPSPIGLNAPDLARAQQHGLAPGIFPSSVYRCADLEEAERLLSGAVPGYAYQRDGHPNADLLSRKCAELHQAEWAIITSSGMAAMAAAVLTTLRAGQHVILSEQLYGKSTLLLADFCPRLGIEVSVVDTFDIGAVRAAMCPATRLLVVETLTNPMLRIASIGELAQVAHRGGALLLVDNTFATPYLCQPFAWGADLVLESISKMMNGHSDVMLGMLCGRGDGPDDYRDAASTWGLASSPFDCWLALRGLSTFHLRMERACQNAQAIAAHLSQHPAVAHVVYPGLADHPDHRLAAVQFRVAAGGSMVTLELSGGRTAVTQFMHACPEIPFCPSLGEVSTTLSHPASTSHRALTGARRAELGITDGTLRLSVGTESAEWIWATLERGLQSVG